MLKVKQLKLRFEVNLIKRVI